MPVKRSNIYSNLLEMIPREVKTGWTNIKPRFKTESLVKVFVPELYKTLNVSIILITPLKAGIKTPMT
jgi:hypothetical protein